MNVTRRAFVATSALGFGPLALSLDPWSTLSAASAQPMDADALFDRSLVIDALSADEDWEKPAPILEAYKKAGLTAIHTSLSNRNLNIALRDLAEWQARFEQWPDRLLKIVKGAQIAEAKKTGRVGVLLGFQNATIVEHDVRNLEPLYQAGARCIQLTYNSRNLLGDGCTERTNAGLSDFGVAVVERMNQLGIAVDLSHCGEATSRDGIAVSTRPPAFTHTMCKGIYDHVRAKSDDLLKALADKGGVVGIAALGYFIGPGAETSFGDYLRHVDHAVKVAGIDHVALASDYSIRGIEATHTRESWYVPRLTSFKPVYRVRWPPWITELDPPERFRNIAHGLAKRGYTSAQIEKILGGNWARYFGEVLG
ncbi:MAG: dipeptidase [Vicinamibacterales bacterium]